MAGNSRKAAPGVIHRISEFELEKVSLADEFDILQIVGEGWFGKILLVEHRATDTEMVLKALPKAYVSVRDFYREFHYGLHLGIHKNVITTYDVAFETAGFYVFSQEYAPLGDLTSNLSDSGIGELHSKRVAKQLASALEHLHRMELVHRDVKLDNVLIFRSDFSRIKLCDFGETRKVNTLVRRRNEWIPYSPPEVLKTTVDATYKTVYSHDVWQFGIVIFVCLTGCLPWQKAAMDDPRYLSYFNWYNSANPLKKPPKLFRMVSSKVQKLFKKLLEPRPERRPGNLSELQRFLDDRWLTKGFSEKYETGETDELCPSMYSFHSNLEEKNKLLHRLLEYGIETTVDRVAKKQRIKDWIQNSIITEENEEEDNTSATATSDRSSEDEREVNLGQHPIEQKNQRWSSIRYSDEKHINPRTGEVIDGSKLPNANMPLSYDMQNIQPVLAKDINVRNKNTDSKLQRLGKDSAYGSLDFKMQPQSNADTGSSSMSNKIVDDPRNFNSQYQHQNKLVVSRSFNNSYDSSKSPVLSDRKTYANGSISSSKSGSFNSTNPMQGSSSTLRSDVLRRSTGLDSPKSGSMNLPSSVLSAAPSYMSMKDSPYDTRYANNVVRDPTSLQPSAENEDHISQLHLNVVQGQIMVNPYSIKNNNNNDNQKGNTMNSAIVQNANSLVPLAQNS